MTMGFWFFLISTVIAILAACLVLVIDTAMDSCEERGDGDE